MMLLSIGDEVREGIYRLHSRFDRAINFTDGRTLVTLVTPDVGAGPVNIVVASLPRASTTPKSSTSPGSRTSPNGQSEPAALGQQPHNPQLVQPPFKSPAPAAPPKAHDSTASGDGTPFKPACPISPLSRDSHIGPTDEVLRVERCSVLLANRRWSRTRAQSYESPLQIRKGTKRTVFRRNLQALARFLAAEAHPKSLAFLLDERRLTNFQTGFEKAMVRRIAASVRQMPERSSVRRLAGCGVGLTPSGDDFIAGTLVALNVLQALTGRDLRGTIKNICAAAERGELLSNTFRRLASEGKVTQRMKNLVSALLASEVGEVFRCARRLLDVGETSGADWMTGLVMTVRNGSEDSP
jgi:hypothetical protein